VFGDVVTNAEEIRDRQHEALAAIERQKRELFEWQQQQRDADDS
jgi:hypothetical protein